MSRHHRQAILPMVGAGGQDRLSRAHVWIVGCGALGCAAADQLARAGIGTLTLIDRDVVDLTNLQRQTLFVERDIDRPKASAAGDRLRALDSTLDLRASDADCTPAFVEQLIDAGKPDAILDGTDSFQTRYLLNDVAVRERIPLVYGGVIATHAMCMAVVPKRGPCLRCIEPAPPKPGTVETCDTAGVLAAAVQIAASMQVSEVLRLLLGEADGSWLIEQDVWDRTHRRIDMTAARDESCLCCGLGRYEFLDERSTPPSVVLCGRGAVQIAGCVGGTIDMGSLNDRLRAHGPTTHEDSVLRCTLLAERADDGAGSLSLMVFPDGRALVRGTSDLVRARAVYARYVGT